MTCIIILKHADKIYMGGDAAINSSDSWLQPASMHPKIWKDGSILIGVGGKQRISQLLRLFKAPAITGDAFDYLQNEYLPKMIPYLETKRVIKTNNDDGMISMDATILIGLAGRIFKIDSSFAITEYPEYVAIGANAEVALGSLYSSENHGVRPENRVNEALHAVLHHCASVREPFTILEGA
jgi:ATP-dependent protease HslVU (ClpYQ) peptidase subunit